MLHMNCKGWSFRFAVVAALACLLCQAAPTQAQLWSGILDPSRATDWTVTGVTGGIPNRTTICSTINPMGSAGAPASALPISNALRSCHNSGGGVVQLAAGTFYLSDSISFSLSTNLQPNTGNSVQNVTLRGAGPDQTILIFSGQGNAWCNQGGLICVSSAPSVSGQCDQSSNPNLSNWTSNYTSGTTQIVLSSIAGNGSMSNTLTAGMYLTLDQLDSPNSDFTNYLPFVTEDPTYTPNICNAQRTNRCVGEKHKVVSITGTGPYTVTITPPLAYQYWDGGKSPQAWWCENVGQLALLDGVENLTADNETNGQAGYGIVQFSGAAQSWMKNVRQMNGEHAQVFIWNSVNIEIRNSYFYGTTNPTGCGVAATQYGIDPLNAGLLKVENNIFQQGCSAVMAQPCYVCVFAYNYFVGDLPQILGGTPNVFWSMEPGHVGGTHLLLFEGNDGNGINTDHGSAHGTSPMIMTAFRNRFSGAQPGVQPSIPVLNQADNRFNSYIGNVVGDPSHKTSGWQYQSYPPSVGSDAVSGFEFLFGWPDSNGLADPITQTSSMRWGNFDYVTNAVRWNTGEIPSGQFVPPQTLPPSFYLISKPTWFGSQPWPVIGPDVTGGTDSSGHAANNPAKNCYLNVMHGPADGSGGPLTFNSDMCYK